MTKARSLSGLCPIALAAQGLEMLLIDPKQLAMFLQEEKQVRKRLRRKACSKGLR